MRVALDLLNSVLSELCFVGLHKLLANSGAPHVVLVHIQKGITAEASAGIFNQAMIEMLG